uniref:NADH-ubiquinone oxidoreductase chain 2 n=1 Tax=Sphaerodactylus shrevei TaxID=302463 RepID=Q5EX42_9SAUR|nr:NADH dehydrogenase subunit 2 [Sphaerodactylus shrevei]
MNPVMFSLLIMTLATSTIITMTSHHWLLAWLGLELNTLAMIPIINKSHHPRATEAATKYFLVQAISAALILLASTINAWQTGQWTILTTTSTFATIILTLALTMKLGLAPTHFWYPEVIQGSTITTALILSTWQKLAPLTLMYMTLHQLPTAIILLIGLTSALIGGWAGLNQTQMRKIMAFSSIAHMGWLMAAMTLNYNLTTLTLTIYITMTTAMFTTLSHTMMKTLPDLGTSWTRNPTLLSMTMLTAMSLGGLPPMTGFTPKWLITKELIEATLSPAATMLILTSLPSLFFYIRLAYFTTLTTPPSNMNYKLTWRFKNHTPTELAPTLTLATLLLPITPIIYYTP